MISLIWAMDINQLIGKGNTLPWYYPEDLKYFKRQTLNQDVLMGYNTYLSIVERIGKPLPNRNNYVLAYNDLDGVTTVKDLEGFIKEYQNKDKNIFVIGGKSVYEQLLDSADFLYITLINKEYIGDVYFPKIDFTKYEKIKEDSQGELIFQIYKKVK